MNVFDVLREKLEEKSKLYRREEEIMKSNPCYQRGVYGFKSLGYDDAIRIVNQVEQDYSANSSQRFEGWIPCNKELPPYSDEMLLVQCNGHPRSNCELINALQLASYTEEGWVLELFPDWEGAEVIAWQPLPEPYREELKM